MEKTVTIADRATKFGPGVWQDESDRVEFRHEGFACLMVRSERSGVWCGYVGVEPGHPWHGLEMRDQTADMHGGCSYAEHCQGDVCHVPAAGEPEHLFWVGFDCNHSCDASPRDINHPDPMWHPGPLETYRTESYVIRQVQSLAEQARAAVSS